MRRHLGTVHVLLALASFLAGCQSSPISSITKLEDVYRLRVTPTRSAYAPGDSVVVRIENGDPLAYRWHRCPGVRLQRETSSGDWADVNLGEDCTDGLIWVPAFNYILIAFVLPPEASAGRYRVLVAVSLPVHTPIVLWWPGTVFEVGST